MVTDRDHRIVRVNRAIELWNDTTTKHLRGLVAQRTWDMSHSRFELAHRTARQGQALRYFEQGITMTGERLWLQVRHEPLPRGCVRTTCVDVSEALRLRAMRTLMRALAESKQRSVMDGDLEREVVALAMAEHSPQAIASAVAIPPDHVIALLARLAT